ncbi:peroxiredoxin [Hydrogenivirga caldilitoris]|uniref:Peroxiredoxin n=1 Tax=Hydrogenivirga caldilitoris TaxID=246264 RepID=A0A497XQ74_9AQUI|nr:TlpA disulfide reductase family protein [Hydrogenivirga caldilitoris]RLJ70279.1 peroxiredoxin [Hydrogenivirga caldilitoris]
MPLKVGDRAPDFRVKSCPEGVFHLGSVKGYRLLCFYKVSCPTCQLTLPFVERMFKSYGDVISFVGVCQDGCPDAQRFARDYSLSFPQVSDEPAYEASIAYDVRVVPTLYLIDPSGNILFVEESFVKSSLENLNEEFARIANREVNPLFEDVSVPPFKAG